MKFKSDVQLEALNNATTDTDKFLVSDSSTIKYRTGAEVLSDIGGQAALTNPVTGTGTTNYLSKFTGSTTLGNSSLFDNGGNVGIGTTSPSEKLDVAGDILINGITIGRGSGNVSSNTANGFEALRFNTTGSQNAANGYQALRNNTTGSYNTANGSEALRFNTTGSSNTANGYQSLLSNTTGEGNVANGFWSLRSNITGAQNVANGYQSLYANTTGNNNVAVGYLALRYNTTGSNNTSIGTQSLYNNVTGDSNVSNGVNSLYNNTTGNFNTGVGSEALYSNTIGFRNTAFGYQTLRTNVDDNGLTAIGYSALYSNNGGGLNTAVGYQALYSNTVANENTAVGSSALGLTVGGGRNTAVGSAAMLTNVGGSNNLALGTDALRNATANSNTAVGSYSLRTNINGSNNVAVGKDSGTFLSNGTTAVTATTNGVFIGSGTSPAANGQNNQIVIGYQAIGIGSNSVVIGNDSITKTLLKGNVGIGTASPGAKLQVDANSQNGIYISNNAPNLVMGDNALFGSKVNSTTVALATSAGNFLTGSLAGDSIFAGKNNLRFGTGLDSGVASGTIKMSILSSGNVGIGTTSPGAKLDVNNNTSVSSSGQDVLRVGGLISYATPGSGPKLTFYRQDNNANLASIRGYVFGSLQTGLAFDTGYDALTTKMVIDNSGNVGIGTTSPSSRLAVRGGYISAGATDAQQAFLGADGSGVGYVGTVTDNSFQLRVNNSAKVLINSSGNVGIGTTSPSSKLDVRRGGSGIIAEFHSTQGVADEYVDIKLISGNSNAGTYGTILRHQRVGSGGGDFAVLTNPTLTSTPVERFRITRDGNVGIGTTSPAYKLAVEGSVAVQNAQNLWLRGGRVGFENTTLDNAAYIYNIGTTGSSKLNIADSLYVVEAGNVGIGTTAPGEHLSVEGSGSQAISIYSTDTGVQSTPKTFIKLYGENTAAEKKLQAQIASAPGHNASNAGELQFFTADSSSVIQQRMTIREDGNVGIGTTSPNTKLQVSALNSNYVNLTGGFSVVKAEEGYGMYMGVASSGNSWIQSATYDNGLTYPLILNSAGGNVGIGVVSPVSKLHVYQNDTLTDQTAGITIEQGGTGDAILQYLQTGAYRWVTGIDNSDGDKFKIGRGISWGLGQDLTIDTSGNVGIGTASPDQKLVVSGTTNIYSKVVTSGVDSTLGINLVNDARSWVVRVDGADGDKFQIRDASAGTQRITIDTSGNVGIGTTSPDYKLDVSSATSAQGIRTKNTAAGFSNLDIESNRTSGSNLGGLRYIQTGDIHSTAELNVVVDGRFYINTGNGSVAPAERMCVDNVGNVGIGTNSPTGKLSISKSSFSTTFTSADSYIRIGKGENGINQYQFIGFGYDNGAADLVPAYIGFQQTATGNYTNGDLVFGTRNVTTNTAPTERMRINGAGNVLIGTTTDAGYKLDVVGKMALNDGGNSVFIGTGAGLNDDGTDNRNVGVGYQALYYNTTGSYNAANGMYALRYNTTGSGNAANGYAALHLNTTGNNNTANGHQALFSNTTGANNVAGGLQSGRYIADKTTAATILNNSIMLGYRTSPLADNQTNQIVIGYDATGIGSNTVVLGNDSIVTTQLKGNVGIGTSSPSAKLELAGVSGEMIRLVDSSTVGNPFISFFQTSTRRSYIQYVDSGDNLTLASEYGGIVLMTGTSGTETEKMRIASSGNVGIGTTSPGAKLSVTDTSNSTTAVFSGLNGGSYSTFNIMTLGTNGNGYWRASTIGGNIKMVSNQPAINVNGYSASAIAFGSDNSQGRIGFFTTSSNTGDTVLTESMRIDTNGNVGIGTTSPNSKLDVYTATTGGNIRLSSNTSTTYGEIRFSSNNGMYLGYGSSIEGTGEGVGVNVGDLRFKTGSGATPTTRMRIASSGNVLIGTTTDAGTDKLQVAGSILASTAGIKIGSTTTSIESDGTSLYLKAGGNTYFNTNISAYVSNAGVMTAANFVLSSDERKKTKIKDLSRDNINVSWKSFEMKNDEGEYRVGVIAQELEIEHPEFVRTDKDGFKSVAYIDLLIAKIAELEARLEKAGI